MPEERNSIQREHAPLRFHHGLGTALALILVFSLVVGYILPSYLPFSSAATTSKIWTTTGDFNNNDTTGEGATTIVQATTTSAGTVILQSTGTSTVSETFADSSGL